MTPTLIQDRDQREQALDISRSFIVQAPAGSGKTELLIQRYLRLLSIVDEPEEIIAITFTKKAASEMRNRVLEALDGADGDGPDEVHARLTWELARKVMGRNMEHGWQLHASPGRLKIQTIDALCGGVTGQLPLLSRFGGQPAIAARPEYLYQEAARAAVLHLEQDSDWSDAVATLLRHLDNDIPRLEGLLISMLSRRDQWIRHVVGDSDEWLRRQELESALKRIVEDELASLVATVPTGLTEEIIRFARFAAGNIQADGKDLPILSCLDIQQMPSASCSSIKRWLGLSDLLLTREGSLRKRKGINKNNGFPTDSDAGKQFCREMKDAFISMLEQLQEHPDFIARLAQVPRLPPTEYTDQQWLVLQSLSLFLRIAVAELKLVMSQRGEVDFIEMALGANMALGDDDNPTDLALALDYRIQHILVDEFQDTSFGQYELLRKLTRGWERDDGRTLFVVGDPMQSIYRFREAEVGLYLRARQEGIGNIPLTPLALSVNFRSQQGIVQWVNQVFRQVLPEYEEIGKGAVSYADSTPFHPGGSKPAVQIHPILGRDDVTEAGQVVELVLAAQREEPEDRVAVLVRSRSHLAAIIPELKQAGLRFKAVEVELLSRRPVISDLMALTRALLHPADRIAWLSVMRAPWCGLSLGDMHALAGGDHRRTIRELMDRTENWAGLSGEGKTRLRRMQDILDQAQQGLRRLPLRDLVQGVWVALGGPAVARSGTELEEAQMLFQLLEEFDHGGDIDDFSALDEALTRLYAPPDTESSDRLQLMTIHAAKGLEFDQVIIPGLGRIPGQDDSRLLYWLERNISGDTSDLLLAPIKRADENEDPIYRYLHTLVREKDRLEDGRLLYVAATRARKRLHLLGHLEWKDGLKDPDSRSLLAALWSASEVRAGFQQLSEDDRVGGRGEAGAGAAPHPIRRLPPDWSLPKQDLAPAVVQAISPRQLDTPDKEILEFDWAGETARQVGTLVHRYLQRIARDGMHNWDRQRIGSLHRAFANALLYLGVPRGELDAAVARVDRALEQALTDDRGRWILSDRHQDSRSEYALSSYHDQRQVNIIVDRTFIDADGVRWIIDYKTGVHEGSDVEVFLDHEVIRYRAQMERYAAIFRSLEERPIRLGLYFPLLSGWRSWDA